MRKSGFTLSINPDKAQHYLSVLPYLRSKDADRGLEQPGDRNQPPNNQDFLCAQTKSIQPSNGIKTFKGSQDIKPNPEYFISNRLMYIVTYFNIFCVLNFDLCSSEARERVSSSCCSCCGLCIPFHKLCKSTRPLK